MSTYAYGVNLQDRSPMSKMLLRELANAGFGRVETLLEREVRFLEDGYILAFGADALRSLSGLSGIAEYRGQMHACLNNPDVLVFVTYSPGFIYRNKENLPLFRDDLRLFKTFINFDRDGVIV